MEGAGAAGAREARTFDRLVREGGDFNPFTDRGWRTLARRFAAAAAGVVGGRLLDVGCGTGRSRRIYGPVATRYIGIDLSLGALAVATGGAPAGGAAWARADACRLPFASATFDVVAFSSVLHHVPDYRAALRAGAAVARPGGLVFAFDPNLLHPAMLAFRHPASPLYRCAGVSPDERPLRPAALRQAFREAGLVAVGQRCQSDIPYRRVAPPVLDAMLALYNAFDWVWERVGLGRWLGTFVVTWGRTPAGAPLMGDEERAPRYSVVVPVHHEAATIGAFCRRAAAELPPGYELLVCYDTPDDSTLPALAALPADQKPANLRLIHNQLGHGARWAIEAGMRAARAPVVLVTMVDLSDDYRIAERMVERAEAGAAVVCASRYMPGGAQIGGPWLKGRLSRCAGLSLHRLSGLPTRDPTNSFKAYRRDFLARTPITSAASFSLALELTVKAHFGGERVEELPATWRDRTAGKSRFRLFAWLPHYLRWYVWALRRRWLSRG